MKVGEFLQQIEKIRYEHPDIDDWDIYSEDERLYTYDTKMLNESREIEGLEDNLKKMNKETNKILREETKRGWKFVIGNDGAGQTYYKSVGYGACAMEKDKALVIAIND